MRVLSNFRFVFFFKQKTAYDMRISDWSLDVCSSDLMGIINLTPDSFFDGSRRQDADEAVRRAGEMLEQGAAMLDLGAYSSRPDAGDISAAEETARLLPALTAIGKQFPEAIISVDTFRAEVARQAVEEGAAIINDISGGHLDSAMPATIEIGRAHV